MTSPLGGARSIQLSYRGMGGWREHIGERARGEPCIGWQAETLLSLDQWATVELRVGTHIDSAVQLRIAARSSPRNPSLAQCPHEIVQLHLL